MNITARRNQQRAQLVRVLEEAHEPRPMRHGELHLPADQRCICKTTLVASPALTHETIIHRHVPSSLPNVAVPSTPLSNPVQPREENKAQSRLSSSPGERIRREAHHRPVVVSQNVGEIRRWGRPPARTTQARSSPDAPRNQRRRARQKPLRLEKPRHLPPRRRAAGPRNLIDRTRRRPRVRQTEKRRKDVKRKRGDN